MIGQILPISQNTALFFSLLGTTYGGDGKSNFALPNLQGAAPMQQGQGPGLSLRDLGGTGGEQNVTVLTTGMPATRSHPVGNYHDRDNGRLDQQSACAGVRRRGQAECRQCRELLQHQQLTTQLSPNGMVFSGGSQPPHNNMMPYLGLTFIIALQGVFPARS